MKLIYTFKADDPHYIIDCVINAIQRNICVGIGIYISILAIALLCSFTRCSKNCINISSLTERTNLNMVNNLSSRYLTSILCIDCTFAPL